MTPVKEATQLIAPATQAAQILNTADDENEESDNDDLDADPSYTERPSSRRRKRSAARTERKSAKKAKAGSTGGAATIELLVKHMAHPTWQASS